MWSSSHWKQSGDWQKDSSTTKAIRKIHAESSRRGREMIRWDLHFRRDHRRGKGYHGLGDPSWGVSSSDHILDSQAWNPTLGRQVRLTSLKTSETYNKRAVWNPNSICEGHIHGCSLPEQGGQSRLKLPGALTCFQPPPQHVPLTVPVTHSSPYSPSTAPQ